MTGEVIEFGTGTKVPEVEEKKKLSAEEVFDKVMQERVKDVIVVAVNEDGAVFMSGNTKVADSVLLLERAKQYLVSV